MATTYSSTAVASTVPARSPSSAGLTAVKATYALTGALVVNDVIQMVKVPLGAVIYGVVLSVPDLDSAGSPAVILAVGDGSDDDRFITGSTVGQAGGVAMLNAASGHGYTYTADDTVDVKVTTAPGTSATTGTITLTVVFAKE